MNRIYIYVLVFAFGTIVMNIIMLYGLESSITTESIATQRQKVLWLTEGLVKPRKNFLGGIFRSVFYWEDTSSNDLAFQKTVDAIFQEAKKILEDEENLKDQFNPELKGVIETPKPSTTEIMIALDDAEPVDLTYASIVHDMDRMLKAEAHRDTEWLNVLRMPTTGYHSFNHSMSDSLGNFRHELPDYRNEACHKRTYDLTKLGKTSIIIIFHNEARSTLLRTIHAILERTPILLLVEIILVDDASTHEWLKDPLDRYLEHLPKILIIRLKQRQGLIRARTRGAEEAKGEVLFFVDAHTEVSDGWLPPLLHRIQENRKVLVFPEMDPIQHQGFEYWRAGDEYQGAFYWHMEFKYKFAPRKMMESRSDPTQPVPSPVMVGCAHAIEKKYFFETGAYDTDMEIWGGENIEHAFRLWMCGGRVEVMPCSRVGHVFKPRLPYSFTGDSFSIIQRNMIRIAETWMGDYKKYFYATQPGVISPVDLESLQKRKAIREKLKCKDFDWYLKNVFPEMPIPGDNAHLFGPISSKRNEGRCVTVNFDTNQLESTRCDQQEWTMHLFNIDRAGVFTFNGSCIIVDSTTLQLNISKAGCPQNNLKWSYVKDRLIEVSIDDRDHCLTLHMNSRLLTVSPCNQTSKWQWWLIIYNFDFSRKIDMAQIVNDTLTPPKEALYFGRLMNAASELCLNVFENQEYTMTDCDSMKSYERILHYDTDGTIRYQSDCIKASPNDDIMITRCDFNNGRGHLWDYDAVHGWIRLRGQERCLAHYPRVYDKVQVLPCSESNPYFIWKMMGKLH